MAIGRAVATRTPSGSVRIDIDQSRNTESNPMTSRKRPSCLRPRPVENPAPADGTAQRQSPADGQAIATTHEEHQPTNNTEPEISYCSELRPPDDADAEAVEDFVGAVLGPTERKFVDAKGELLTLLWDRRASPNLRDRLASRLGDLAEDIDGLRDVFADYEPAGPPPLHVMVIGLPLLHRPPGSDTEVHGVVTGYDGPTVSFIDDRGRRWRVPYDQVGLLGPPISEGEPPACWDEQGRPIMGRIEVAAAAARPFLDQVACEFRALSETGLLEQLVARLEAIAEGMRGVIATGFIREAGALDRVLCLREAVAGFRDSLPTRCPGADAAPLPAR